MILKEPFVSELPKKWVYRSFFNKPVPPSQDPSFLWATGKANFEIDGKSVTGTLNFLHPITTTVNVTGTAEVDEAGHPSKLALVGTNAAGFRSEISGWFVPELEGAKGQVLAVVGSVIDKRSGMVGSFVLTQSE
jgi:hypothetical protein